MPLPMPSNPKLLTTPLLPEPLTPLPVRLPGLEIIAPVPKLLVRTPQRVSNTPKPGSEANSNYTFSFLSFACQNHQVLQLNILKRRRKTFAKQNPGSFCTQSRVHSKIGKLTKENRVYTLRPCSLKYRYSVNLSRV